MTAEREREHSEARPYSEVVLLLGAGASVEAGAPTVTQLVERFSTYLARRKPELLPTYRELRRILEGFRPVADERAIVDVELLMTALTLLIEREKNPLSAFANNWKSFVASNDRRLPQLLDALQGHIRQQCTVEADQIDYLRPLGDFIRQFRRLDIFTLNYDAAIELTLQKEEFSYTDGFDVYWNATLLASTDYAARLFKLHGSLLWFVTSAAPRRLVKIPVKTAAGLPEFFSDEQVSHNLIYPVLAKEQHVEPYATLMNHLRQALSQASVLLAMGCSFRDTYIKQVVVERMLQNRNLRLCLADPRAAEVLKQSDRMVDQRWTFASVASRISTLSLEAGEALSGRLLFNRTLALSELGGTQADHVGAVLQKHGSGPTEAYSRTLVDLRLLAEMCAACQDRSTGEAFQSATVTRVKGASLEGTLGKLAPVAIYMAGHFALAEWKDVGRNWLRAVISHIVRHVCFADRIYLGDGQNVIKDDNAQSYAEGRREELNREIAELQLWLSSSSLGVPEDVVSKSAALFHELEVFRDYFSSMLRDWPEHARRFSNLDGTIHAPKPKDSDLLAEMADHFDADGPAILRVLTE